MIEKLTKDCIYKIICEIKKKENKERIEKEIINPVFITFIEKIFPYALILFIIYIINIILVIIILFKLKT